MDELLASRHYGEKWASWWLDLARYADTKGYVFEEERRYAFAYTYRDWVVRSFNQDLPYDRFLIYQIAGGLLLIGVVLWAASRSEPASTSIAAIR